MCSLDARSGRPIQATLLEEVRASLEGTLYIEELSPSITASKGIRWGIDEGSEEVALIAQSRISSMK
jgi:hypothetical protein